MFRIRNANSEDNTAAMSALGDAFERDPLMLYLFRDNPEGIRAGITGFFSILFKARIELAMPALLLEHDGEVSGAIMGYDTSRPEWPKAVNDEWHQFEASVPGFAGRLAAYETICLAHEPKVEHYYLGVIGVRPSLQGNGAGKALLDLFCTLSRDDPKSNGVYLETCNPASLQFYYNNGFELRGEGRLDQMPLWCLYRRT